MQVFTPEARIMLTLLCLLTLPVTACDKGGGGNKEEIIDSESKTETDTGPVEEGWAIQMVTETAAGIQMDLKTGPDDSLGLAFFANDSFEDGICNEVEVNPPVRLRQTVYYASFDPSGEEWIVEQVDDPVVILEPTGLSLEYDAQGRPAIAYTGGIPEGQYCGGHDAVLAVREQSGWTFETASSQSGDSATGISGSDEGFVVGFWPGLAYNSTGEPAIIHKDVHFGALQSIDFKRADAEFAMRFGGGWSHEAIDPNEGAGSYGTVLFDFEDRPVVFYTIPLEAQVDSRFGVWGARRSDTGDWDEKVHLFEGAVHETISAGFNPVTGELVVAFYSAEDAAVRVKRISDMEGFADSKSWESEIVGDAAYDEGRHVSLDFTPSGREILAYHRCRLYSSSSDGCDQNDEAVILAVEKDGYFEIEKVDEAELGSCGAYTSLAVDSTGKAHVAYRCTVSEGDEFYFRLFVASRNVEERL